MDHAFIVQQVLDYIEEHLPEDMSLAVLSQEACLSQYHLHRVFRSAVGMPVMEFIRKRRLTRAAQALFEGERIVDVALAWGYGSQEAFSRAFNRTFGCSPGAFGKTDKPVTHTARRTVWRSVLTSGGGEEIRVGSLPRRELIGLDLPLASRHPLFILQLWARLCACIGGSRRPAVLAEPHYRYGIWRRSTSGDADSYFVGAAVRAGTPTPQGMDRVVLPQGEYVSLVHQGHLSMDRIQASYDGIHRWVKENGRRYRLDAPVVEVYDIRQPMCHDYRTLIYEPVMGGRQCGTRDS